MEVEAQFSVSLRLCNHSKPVFLDRIVFQGELDTEMTLYSSATVKPRFYRMPVTGDPVAFASLFAHNIPQIRLIRAIAHLFGLYFYTDESTKTVCVEPRFTFLTHENETDWTAKIDPEQEIILEEWGADRHRIESYRYRPGDAAVDRVNAWWGTVYGSWEANVENRFAAPDSHTITNPLFTATKDETDSLASAPHASMIVAGDRENKASLNFPAKIVRYLCLKNLPDGETWGWPGYGRQYPLVMFHSAGEDWYTLCFEDIGGQLGLKNYHLDRYRQINSGKKLTVYLHLRPGDLEQILHPNSLNRNFRGSFVFHIRGEKIRARLLEISGYRPDSTQSARCVFSVEL
ncbi:MAG: hypothetical protein LUD68_03435 [Rikenellaceae bacterium]|nr:hypothetical protein [Rikenellaceae bacterium]